MDFRKLLQDERRRARENAAPKPIPPQESTEISSDNDRAITGECVSSPAPCETSNEPLTCWHPRTRLDLEPFRVPGIQSVFYIPEWLSQEEEFAILSRVDSAPPSAWVPLKLRRLQMYGGDVELSFRPEPLPHWLHDIANALVANGIFGSANAPNHVLINEYGVGDGILPHQDGPRYFPLVAIASTGADAFVSFSPHRTHADALRAVRFAVRRCSLLVFTDDAYTKWLHSIDGVESGKRVSLTIRHVHVATATSDTP